jgi:hypothetical protein
MEVPSQLFDASPNRGDCRLGHDRSEKSCDELMRQAPEA